MKPEAALDAINKALFPDCKVEGGVMTNGDAILNLEGALIDLKRTGADRVCIQTVERVRGQLIEVSKVLCKAGLK